MYFEVDEGESSSVETWSEVWRSSVLLCALPPPNRRAAKDCALDDQGDVKSCAECSELFVIALLMNYLPQRFAHRLGARCLRRLASRTRVLFSRTKNMCFMFSALQRDGSKASCAAGCTFLCNLRSPHVYAIFTLLDNVRGLEISRESKRFQSGTARTAHMFTHYAGNTPSGFQNNRNSRRSEG